MVTPPKKKRLQQQAEGQLPRLRATRDQVLGSIVTVQRNTSAVVPDRLTLVAQISHQQRNQQPISSQIAQSFYLENEVQPYVRRMEVGFAKWEDLDLGWFREIPEQVGMILLENKSRLASAPGQNAMVVSPEQRAELNRMALLVRFKRRGSEEDAQDGLVIRAGRPALFEPWRSADDSIVQVRGLAAKVLISLTIYPA